MFVGTHAASSLSCEVREHLAFQAALKMDKAVAGAARSAQIDEASSRVPQKDLGLTIPRRAVK